MTKHERRHDYLKQKRLASLGIVITLLIGMGTIVYATVFSSTYDTATPLGTDAPSSLDDHDRLTKSANQERNNVDHYWPLSGTQVSDADAGEHRKVLFHAPIAATPTVAASHGDLRIKDVSGKAEFTWTDEDEQELIITDAGTLNIVSADLLGTLANNTYFTAVDIAGTGTVDLIKSDVSNVATIPDGSQMATSAAPISTNGIANKKYVDDQQHNAAFTPASYAGGESVTFPNGLIVKMGAFSPSSNPDTVTFVAAFPNAIVGLSVTPHDNTNPDFYVSAYNASAFTAIGAASQPTTYLWTAIGH